METFTYRPLSPSEDTRLIVLLPASSSEALASENPEGIKCEIEHIALAKNPSYEALSYCWGNPTQTRRYVTCEGARLNVTETLYGVLVRMQQDNKPVRLWVDAICINQNDNDEKSLQVPRMRDIYGQSMGVLIWLGEETPEVQGSLQFAELLEEASLVDDTPIMQRHVWAFPNRHIPPPEDESWKTFFALLQRPWFRRLWIIQEVAVSPNPMVVCGRSRVTWDTLQAAVKYTSLLGIHNLFSDVVDLNIIRDLQNARDQYMGETQHSLVKLMTRTRASLATNPRDKIFGLWGIAEPSSVARLQLSPSYTITPECLFRNFAMATLTTARNLDIFQVIQPRDGSKLNALPSWVPDWSLSGSFVPLRHLELAYAENQVPEWQDVGFKATGETQSSPVFTVDKSLLELRGHIVGVLDEVSCIINLQCQNRRNPILVMAHAYGYLLALRDCERVSHARSETLYRNEERILDCYWQTLSAAVMPGGYRICHEEFQKFDAFVQTAHSFICWGLFVPFLNRLPLFQAGIMMMAIVYQAVFHKFDIQDLSGFQGNVGASSGRRMARTSTEYIGLVPRDALVGDGVVLLEGGKVPLIIRLNEDDSPEGTKSKGARWQIIGEAYIHGIMKGEAFNPKQCQRFSFS
jgi:hypothetical protein